ncbi:protein translocase subunit [Coemansia nantahalensis]|uniref:Protein translocase subunit n=2 Tax=Coemansia TaxID=4863 RepID=A0ACC1LGB8_9FUNG|nr:protein translocase subunit [Coemansia nantahalensis]KAJ2769916.1 protein translocase subunit [Coemansia nantahalensis]KAJ2807090.1 protein translocase subunit [Coemansia helicoidea]
MQFTGTESKEEVMRQLKSELAVANAQELVASINRHCFKMCIPAPSSSLSSADKANLSRCTDKYLAAWDVVSREYVAQAQKQKN